MEPPEAVDPKDVSGDPNDYATFSFFAHPGTSRLTLQVLYQGCEVEFTYPHTEQGLASASNLADQFDTIWHAALRELAVKNAMDSVESELDDLLGDEPE